MTSANLAASFARAGERTILVDANLGTPPARTLRPSSTDGGLTTLLTDDPVPAPKRRASSPPSCSSWQRLDRHLVATEVPGLSLLPAGPATETDPGELTAASGGAKLLEGAAHGGGYGDPG